MSKRLNLQKQCEVFNQPENIEKLKLKDTATNGFSIYKSKVNNKLYFSVKEYCIKLDIKYDISKFHDLKYPDVMFAYIDNNNTKLNVKVLLITLEGMKKYIESTVYRKTKALKKQIYDELKYLDVQEPNTQNIKDFDLFEEFEKQFVGFEKLNEQVSIQETANQGTTEESVQKITEETITKEHTTEETTKEECIKEEYIKQMSGMELVQTGINKIIQEEISKTCTGMKKETALTLETTIRNAMAGNIISKSNQKELIKMAVNIHCNRVKCVTHEYIYNKLYSGFGNAMGRNFTSIKNSFTKENKTILDIIVNDLNLGIELIRFYYDKFDYIDIEWAINTYYYCCNDKNLMKVYLNCILDKKSNYR